MWSGDLPVRHVIVLSEHLTLNPHSRVFAIRGGSPELQGWDSATVIAARTHNLIASLILGLSKDKKTDLFIEYPGAEKHQADVQPRTIAELLAGPLAKFAQVDDAGDVHQ